MKNHLILKLRPPPVAGGFRIGFDESEWKFTDSSGIYPEALLDKLNARLPSRLTAGSRVSIFRSFPKTVGKLRDSLSGSKPDPALALYFRIAYPIGTISQLDLKPLFDDLTPTDVADVVESVSFSGPVRTTQPQGDLPSPLAGSSQGGFGAMWASRLPGGDGGNVKVFLLDEGYDERHRDLPQERIGYIARPDLPDTTHGTWVLGVIVAKEQPPPLVGIAPRSEVWVSSTRRVLEADEVDRVGPIPPDRLLGAMTDIRGTLAAIDDVLALKGDPLQPLEAGDVIMLQQERAQSEFLALPLETDPDIRAALALADVWGVTVVEPAGNGGSDVGLPFIDPIIGAASGESQPIMVGAGSPPGPDARKRLAVSNYGERVDCQGWGAAVHTTHVSSATNTQRYVENFDGTSAATAIVAGLVAVVQSVAKAAGTPLPPYVLRAKMRTLGAVQEPRGTAPPRIGPQPDLELILRDCNLVPDAYIRDHLEDDGAGRTEDGLSIWSSPDIVSRRIPELPPNVAQQLLDSWDEDLSQQLRAGVAGRVYVRVANRGPFPVDARVALYQARLSTFPSPPTWEATPIGAQHLHITANDGHAVTRGFTWTTPSQGKTLVAVVTSRWDTMPSLSPGSSEAEYVEMVRRSNNIAIRSDAVAPQRGGLLIWHFRVRQSRDPDHRMGLFIRSNLPSGARMMIGLPRQRASALLGKVKLKLRSTAEWSREFAVSEEVALQSLGEPIGVPWSEGDDTGQNDIGWFGTTREALALEPLELDPGEEVSMVVSAKLPENALPTACGITVEQFLEHPVRRFERGWATRVGRINLRIPCDAEEEPTDP